MLKRPESPAQVLNGSAVTDTRIIPGTNFIIETQSHIPAIMNVRRGEMLEVVSRNSLNKYSRPVIWTHDQVIGFHITVDEQGSQSAQVLVEQRKPEVPSVERFKMYSIDHVINGGNEDLSIYRLSQATADQAKVAADASNFVSVASVEEAGLKDMPQDIDLAAFKGRTIEIEKITEQGIDTLEAVVQQPVAMLRGTHQAVTVLEQVYRGAKGHLIRSGQKIVVAAGMFFKGGAENGLMMEGVLSEKKPKPAQELVTTRRIGWSLPG